MIEQSAGIGLIEPASLDQVTASAALLERTDRKYLVRRQDVDRLVADLASTHRVLDVAGRRTTTYRTVYFDSEDLRSVRDHIQGRRRRFKARTRLYVEDGLCRVEVKTRGNRGQTVKVMREINADHLWDLDAEHQSFIVRELDLAGIRRDQPMIPTIEVNCRRTTLVDTRVGSRLTIDDALTCTWNGRRMRLDDDWLIVETKSPGHAGRADTKLRRLGYRPRSFSKYAAAGAALSDDISSNDFRRLFGTQLHLEDVSA